LVITEKISQEKHQSLVYQKEIFRPFVTPHLQFYHEMSADVIIKINIGLSISLIQ